MKAAIISGIARAIVKPAEVISMACCVTAIGCHCLQDMLKTYSPLSKPVGLGFSVSGSKRGKSNIGSVKIVVIKVNGSYVY